MKNSLRWHDVLTYEKKKSYFSSILETVEKERKSGIIVYPSQKDVFNAFRLTELYDVKVVILGQDPYCRPRQAHGLAFSVPFGIAIPPSLLNIYKELKKSIPKFSKPNHGCLNNWARQGAFLLNAILTVRAGQPGSHANIGWETFTDKTISLINKHQNGVVFLLWGAFAQKKENLIDKKRHCVLKTTHPSPLSAHRGFLGCNHFALTNQWLRKHDKKQINWLL